MAIPELCVFGKGELIGTLGSWNVHRLHEPVVATGFDVMPFESLHPLIDQITYSQIATRKLRCVLLTYPEQFDIGVSASHFNMLLKRLPAA